MVVLILLSHHNHTEKGNCHEEEYRNFALTSKENREAPSQYRISTQNLSRHLSSWEQGKLPKALAGRGGDCIRHRRGYGRNSRFADPCRFLRGRNDVHLDLRHAGETQRPISIEVRLLHAPGVESHGLFESCRQAEGNATLQWTGALPPRALAT